MSNAKELYDRWLAQPDLNDAIKAELVSVAGNDEAITDRFIVIWNSAPADCAVSLVQAPTA